MPDERFDNDEKKRISSINFLQSQIAKYYGNDGILSSKEKKELDNLSRTLVDAEQYERLIEIAKDEICNFKKFDVVSYLLEREDKLKLYSDAERLSIRISRVERWVSELKDIINPKEDEKVNKREILIDKMKKIMKWFDQELYVETNVDIGNDHENAEKTEDKLEIVKDDVVADEINDFMNDEKNLAWRSYSKQLLYKWLKDESVKIDENLKDVFDYISVNKSRILHDLNKDRKKDHQYGDLKEIQYEDVETVLSFEEKRDSWFIGKGKAVIRNIIGKGKAVVKKIKSLFPKEKDKSKDELNDKPTPETFENKTSYKSFGETIKSLFFKDNKESLKDLFEKSVKKFVECEKSKERNSVNSEEENADERLKQQNYDEIKIRIRQYSDIKKLFEKNGYKESRTEVDFQKHPAAMVVYVLIVVACFLLIDGKFFRNLDKIHRFVGTEKNLTDNRDRIKYTTVDINGVRWMAENLNYSLDSCKSCVVVAGLPKSGGLFYSWEEAVKACPSGWRLPTRSEWQGLIDYFGSDSAAAFHLKSESSSWEEKGSDSVGFSALPAGYYNVSNGGNVRENMSASWWAYSMKSDKEVYVAKIGGSTSGMRIDSEKGGYDYHSVRCVKIDGKKVPYASYPKSDKPMVMKKIKGTVVDFKKGMDLPIVRFNGKAEALYDSVLFAKIAMPEDSMSQIKTTVEEAEKAKRVRRIIFPANSSVEMTRFYEPVYSWNGTAWRDSSLWREDSVKVSGKYTVVDLDFAANSNCLVGFAAFVGGDSTTANVEWPHSCDSLKKGDEYFIDIYYVVFEQRVCNDGCAENSSLAYRFVKVDVHAE